jgi:hypothetical protein
MSPSRSRVVRWFGVAALFLLASCARKPGSAASGAAPGPWTNLLDGSANAWRGYRADSLPAGWRFDRASGVLSRSGAGPGGDIVTRAEYGDFELELDWRISPKGNSGVFFRANEATDDIYENATEMQVLDNGGHPDGRNPLTNAGSNFGLVAPVRDVTRPVGEWNRARIVAVGPHVEHWLNGTKLLEYDLWTPAWTALVKGSKFGQWPAYGLGRRGHIGLQDHGNEVGFRNIRIRELGR